MPEEQKNSQLIPPHGGYQGLKSYKSYIEYVPAEVAANTMNCLIHQSNFLLDQQLRALEKKLLEEAGFTEEGYRTRTQARSRVMGI